MALKLGKKEKIFNKVNNLIQKKEKLEEMAENCEKIAFLDVNQKIFDFIQEII